MQPKYRLLLRFATPYPNPRWTPLRLPSPEPRCLTPVSKEGLNSISLFRSLLLGAARGPKTSLSLEIELSSLASFLLQLEAPKAEEFDELQNLKQSNDQLLKEVEKLQLTHCSDVEELVYLRWVNVCLRYELRNYQPPKGKMVARDLSKCLSPRSEEKAKQLLLEYANSHDDEKAMNGGDLNSYSSSHVSTGESVDVFMEISPNLQHSSNKLKFFSKLKKLVVGKEHSYRVSSVGRTPPSCGNSDR